MTPTELHARLTTTETPTTALFVRSILVSSREPTPARCLLRERCEDRKISAVRGIKALEVLVCDSQT